jgi:DNA polymerase bacteriophage-type
MLHIDVETFSSVDLIKCGVYAYAAALDFELLVFAYAFDDDAIRVVDLASGERLPGEVLAALLDETIIKTAFNAQFERTTLAAHLQTRLSPVSWQCTAVQASMLGLPLSLDGVAQVLRLPQQKLREGKDLIRYFSVPCKPTKSNGGRNRNLPAHHPEKWETFKRYCIQDVAVERAIRIKLSNHPISKREQEFYTLDQQINDRGVLIDKDLVSRAIACDRLNREDTFALAQKLTGLPNPNSVAQLKDWLVENGVEVESLSKKTVAELIKENDGDIESLLRLRLQMAKTSIKKYEAMARVVCPDGRVRGLLQFYGANRTGRHAGRLIQIQNLPQNHLPDLGIARALVKQGAFDTLEMLYNVPVLLSELIRTAFIPKPNHRFIVSDFSAIEARVVAWLSGETWVLDTFTSGKGIYEATAARMYGIPEETVVKGHPHYEYRQKGKQACLACGYQGSVGALVAMGADMTEAEMKKLVKSWRTANPNIVQFWYAIEKAAIQAVKKKTSVQVGRIRIYCQSGFLFIELPSKRKLSYAKPRIEHDETFNKEGITFEGIGDNKRWSRIKTYSGKLVENITQAVARDLLMEALTNVSKAGYDIVMHCHDEIIVEAPVGFGSLAEVCAVMGIAPDWAEGLPLKAEGFECSYYKK